MTKPKLPPMIVSLANAAKELDLSSERIRQLIKDGLIDRGPRGKVSMISAYRGLVKFLRDDSRRTSKSASASRVQDARSREIELRTAEREGRLMDVEEVRAVVAEWGGALRSNLASIPARLSRDMTFRRKMETEIDDAFRQTTERFEKAMGDRPAPGSAVEADSGNDTR